MKAGGGPDGKGSSVQGLRYIAIDFQTGVDKKGKDQKSLARVFLPCGYRFSRRFVATALRKSFERTRPLAVLPPKVRKREGQPRHPQFAAHKIRSTPYPVAASGQTARTCGTEAADRVKHL